MSKIFIFKPLYEYDHKAMIPSQIEDYKQYSCNDTVFVLAIDKDLIKYNNTEYIKRFSNKTGGWPFNIIPGKCIHYGELFAKSEWTIYENGYAKFDVFGKSTPIIKSLIGQLEPF